MVSGIPIVGITQNERFLSCDIVLLGLRFVEIGVCYLSRYSSPLNSIVKQTSPVYIVSPNEI
jgi:hypothetical protein